MSEELKPCPFCNEKAELKTEEWEKQGGYNYDIMHYVECSNCYASSYYFKNEISAISTWNDRVKEPQP